MTKAAFKMTSTTPIITIATTVPITAPAAAARLRENTFFLSADRKNVFSLRRSRRRRRRGDGDGGPPLDGVLGGGQLRHVPQVVQKHWISLSACY